MRAVSPDEMRLPTSPIPRPGERVKWYAEARAMAGIVLGHDTSGDAIVRNDFGTEQHIRFDDVRLEDPFRRVQPNWFSLPPGGKLLKPNPEMHDLLRQTMDRVIPPGPTYRELVEEIWGRGFEVFLVGGTVRDILAGQIANDVDLVTTMPLHRMIGFLQQMFRTRAEGYGQRGYIRLGGKPASGDPFIDLKVFSDSLPGTNNATFGVGFDRDVAYRDFTCNAVYYDPMNDVILDPTGQGVDDCTSTRLRLVAGNHHRHQMGQVFIRAIKFAARGFSFVPQTQEILIAKYLPSVAAMKREARERYFHTQVTSKHVGNQAKIDAIAAFKHCLVKVGCPNAWNEFFDFDTEDMNDV